MAQEKTSWRDLINTYQICESISATICQVKLSSYEGHFCARQKLGISVCVYVYKIKILKVKCYFMFYYCVRSNQHSSDFLLITYFSHFNVIWLN
jgi:hypothetical protein